MPACSCRWAARATGSVARWRRAALLGAVELARDHELATVLARAVLELVGRGGRGAAIGMPDAEQEELLREALHAMRHWPLLGSDDDATRELLVVTLEGELSLAMLFSDRHEERCALVLEAEARVRSRHDPDPVLLARVLLNARPAKTAPQLMAERLGDVREVLALPADLLSGETRVAALTYLHEDLLRIGDRPRARRYLADARRAADRIGHPFWQWATTTWASLDLVVDGRLDDAEQLLATSLSYDDGAPAEALACLGVQLTDIRLFQGRAAEVVDMLTRAAAANDAIPCYRAVLALVASQAGRASLAEEHYAWFSGSEFTVLPEDSNRFLGLAVLGDLAADLGDVTGAALLAELLLPYADQQVLLNCYGGGGAYWGPTARVLGRLASIAGDREVAAHWFARAQASARSFGAPLALERVRYDADRSARRQTAT